MTVPGVTAAELRAVVADELNLLHQIAAGLSDSDLVGSTGCQGWRGAELVVHLRHDSEALLLGFSTPTDAPIDRDYVSYWRDWPAKGPATFADVRWISAQAASYANADGLRRHFADVAAAAVNASRHAPAGRMSFQDHVIDADDLLAMWAVEFAVHHLDLLVTAANDPGPEPAALELAALTLEGLLGAERPPWWDLVTYVRKGTGREPLDSVERARLGDQASAYPALG